MLSSRSNVTLKSPGPVRVFLDLKDEMYKAAVRQDRKGKTPAAGISAICIVVFMTLACVFGTVRLWAWGALPHQQIVDAALTAIPASDELPLRLGSEARHLRDTVEMADWMNSLIVVQENWHVTTEDFPQIGSEYFGNDYLLFPAAPHFFSHMMPQVHQTYGPYFLRALQALRTEDQVNAVRWIGSLLHFVTDSGSPPHTIGLSGPNHTKMENWLDASHIDLRGYRPQLLGHTDGEAVTGLEKRMDGLIARNAAIARKMLPYAQADDRTQVEPMALDCATETARVTADVIHTLLVLTAARANGNGTSMVATVTAPGLTEHPLLPAKLVLLGTEFSTLSSLDYTLPGQYSGSFLLRNLPPGHYHAAIERVGAETLFPPAFTLRAGQQRSFDWHLEGTAPVGNLVPNADFTLRWVTAAAPDHWRHDDKCHCWHSDNIPVIRGGTYRAFAVPRGASTRAVALEWMAQHWKQTDDPAVPVGVTQDPAAATQVTAPAAGVYARFAIVGDEPPESSFSRLVLLAPAQADSVPRR